MIKSYSPSFTGKEKVPSVFVVAPSVVLFRYTVTPSKGPPAS
jgi:hypothetical protein